MFPFTLHLKGDANGNQRTQEVGDTDHLSQVLKENLNVYQPNGEVNLVEVILESERIRVASFIVYRSHKAG